MTIPYQVKLLPKVSHFKVRGHYYGLCLKVRRIDEPLPDKLVGSLKRRLIGRALVIHHSVP